MGDTPAAVGSGSGWRETRHRLNGAERWFAGVRDRLDPYDAMLFNELLALAYAPEHADYLADYARELAASLRSDPRPDA